MSRKKQLFAELLDRPTQSANVNERDLGSNNESQTFHESNLHAKKETFHESKNEYIPQGVSESETKLANEIKGEPFSENKHEVHQDMKQESTTKIKPETVYEPVAEPITEVQAELESQNESKVKVNMKSKTKTQSNNETNNDPASILFNRIGTKKEYVEDKRIRRTYWLTRDEIKMVDELAKITGMDKYEVVSLAIQSMHARAMEMKGK